MAVINRRWWTQVISMSKMAAISMAWSFPNMMRKWLYSIDFQGTLSCYGIINCFHMYTCSYNWTFGETKLGYFFSIAYTSRVNVELCWGDRGDVANCKGYNVLQQHVVRIWQQVRIPQRVVKILERVVVAANQNPSFQENLNALWFHNSEISSSCCELFTTPCGNRIYTMTLTSTMRCQWFNSCD